jgi:putative salt-induced outer membrane protein YdiY
MGLLLLGLVGWPSGLVAEEEEGWTSDLALGLTVNGGNSDSTTLTAAWGADRTWESRSFRTRLEGTYGEADGEKNTENYQATLNLKEVLNRRSYLALDGQARRDTEAEVDYRAIVSPGLGVYLLKSDTRTLTLDLGPAYIAEDVGGLRDDYWAIRFGERYEHQLSEHAKLWQSLAYLPRADNIDDYLVQAEAGVEARLTVRFSLRLVGQYTYDIEPAPGLDEEDYQIVAGLVVQLL